jgi:hypothetical protein
MNVLGATGYEKSWWATRPRECIFVLVFADEYY